MGASDSRRGRGPDGRVWLRHSRTTHLAHQCSQASHRHRREQVARRGIWSRTYRGAGAHTSRYVVSEMRRCCKTPGSTNHCVAPLLSAALSTLNDVVCAAKAELQLSSCGAPSQLLVRLTCRCCVCHGYQVDARSVMCGLWLWGLRLTGVDPTGSLGMTTTSQQPQKGCNSASRRPV